jgi:enhancing lycopene biosynthesis protein 2
LKVLVLLPYMMMERNVAVVLSGCGVYDGTEIHEAVLSLLAIEEAGATWQCFAPNTDQMHVIDHTTGEPMDDRRNVLVEAARIARGDIKDLADYDADQYDALVFPGGFGGAKNLSDFAVKGKDAEVRPDVARAVKTTQEAGKPIGFICITPASVGALTTKGTKLTVGADEDGAAAAIRALGCTHVACPVEEAVVDEEHNVVSTPAYMTAGSVLETRKGIQRCVEEVLRLAEKTVIKEQSA